MAEVVELGDVIRVIFKANIFGHNYDDIADMPSDTPELIECIERGLVIRVDDMDTPLPPVRRRCCGG